ncbi:MAG: Helix-turn-helix domain [Myxococcales bacterium]|nr:Helix-turn-helix domain [Myxococcales bacterium]
MANRKRQAPGGPEIAAEYKLLVVQERMKGASVEDVAKAFGVSAPAVQKWTKAFRNGGPSALESKRSGPRRKRAANPVVRERVIALKREHEPYDPIESKHERRTVAFKIRRERRNDVVCVVRRRCHDRRALRD